PDDQEKAEIDKRVEEIKDQLGKMDENNPSQFRARQLLQKEMKDLKNGNIKLKSATVSTQNESPDDSALEKRGPKTCKDLETDESIRMREEGARKKKRGCLEHIAEQQRRLEEIKERMAMHDETRKRVMEMAKAIMEMRTTMQLVINKMAEETRSEMAIVVKKLEHHDQDLALRKEIHMRYKKEHQSNSSDWTSQCLKLLTQFLLFGLYVVAYVRDKLVRPAKAYFSAEKINGSVENVGAKEID
ncbi:hypothetical protein PFISCL1PPCAC_1563, partial [Pristionchus fissidentatus]